MTDDLPPAGDGSGPAAPLLSGWGRFPRFPVHVERPRDEAALAGALARGPLIARGNGRAYGDAALNACHTVDMRGFDRMISFDATTGLLVAEAGVLLADIIAAFLPRGWFPLVTPGTKFVTLGGMIAADVHGKNHHRDGAMQASVAWFDLMGADGRVQRCDPGENADLFAHTFGAMGLTGIILRAGLRLRPVESGWIRQETVAAPGLASAMEVFEGAMDSTYSVAWIDCMARGDALGRSLVMLGEHARLEELDNRRRARPLAVGPRARHRMPVDLPAALLNRHTLRAFNALYWWKGQRARGTRLIDWDSYFYPLDALRDWNRVYGRRGFAQFQCVLPLPAAGPGLRRLLHEIAAAGQGSFLAVLKRFGPQDSPFSFPMEGYTLALDFPANPRTLDLMDLLDAITLDHGGRFYLAKDARMRAETLARADPRLPAFRAFRAEAARDRTFVSALSERLQL